MKFKRVKLAAISGLGAAIAILALAWSSVSLETALLMAPFGASCVLLFSVPSSPLAQPKSVVFGHLLASLVGVVLGLFFDPSPWSMSAGVAFAVALMSYFRVTHPPAGADPLVILAGFKGPEFLLFPVLFGSVALVLIACVFHRYLTEIPYPARPEKQ